MFQEKWTHTRGGGDLVEVPEDMNVELSREEYNCDRNDLGACSLSVTIRAGYNVNSVAYLARFDQPQPQRL